MNEGKKNKSHALYHKTEQVASRPDFTISLLFCTPSMPLMITCQIDSSYKIELK